MVSSMFLDCWWCHIGNMKLKFYIFFEWIAYHFLVRVSQWKAILVFSHQCYQWYKCWWFHFCTNRFFFIPDLFSKFGTQLKTNLINFDCKFRFCRNLTVALSKSNNISSRTSCLQEFFVLPSLNVSDSVS